MVEPTKAEVIREFVAKNPEICADMMDCFKATTLEFHYGGAIATVNIVKGAEGFQTNSGFDSTDFLRHVLDTKYVRKEYRHVEPEGLFTYISWHNKIYEYQDFVNIDYMNCPQNVVDQVLQNRPHKAVYLNGSLVASARII